MRKGGKLEGWKVEKLGDVVDFMNGLWTGKKAPFIYVGVIRNTNFTKDCELDDSNIVYLDVEKSQFAKRKLQYGDIILEKSGGGPKQPVGRVVIFDKHKGDFSFSNFTSMMRVKDNSQIDFHYLHKYLFHAYISGTTEKMQSHSTGIRNLKFDDYKQIPVPVPPLREQQRIVSVLDEALASIAKAMSNAERNLINAGELLDSVLQSIKAEKKPLGNLVEIKTGKLNANAAVVDGEYPFFTCSREIYAIDKYAFDCEAILLAGNNASGDFNVKHYKGKFNAYQRTYVITVNEKNQILYRWLYYQLLNSLKEFKKQSVGANTKFLKLGMIQNMRILLPPLDEQRAIVGRLEALSAETGRLEEIYQLKVRGMEELKKSLLQRVFAGEL